VANLHLTHHSQYNAPENPNPDKSQCTESALGLGFGLRPALALTVLLPRQIGGASL